MTELKPCPFCGIGASLTPSGLVRHPYVEEGGLELFDCIVAGLHNPAAWDRRATDPELEKAAGSGTGHNPADFSSGVRRRSHSSRPGGQAMKYDEEHESNPRDIPTAPERDPYDDGVRLDMVHIRAIWTRVQDELADYDHPDDTTFWDEVESNYSMKIQYKGRVDFTKPELRALYLSVYSDTEHGEPEFLEALMKFDRRKRHRRSTDLLHLKASVAELQAALSEAYDREENDDVRGRLDHNIARMEQRAREADHGD